MHRALLLAGAALLVLAGPAVAGEPLTVVYQNVQSLSACVETAVEGEVGVGFDSSQLPGNPVTLVVPSVTPPTPDCIVVP